jgi:ParB-like chromosome segregation protein Spo0J/KaiC/GvpD/RAD55 family RecA-like ATPase
MITLRNISSSKIPLTYRKHIPDIEKALKTGLYKKDKEVKQIIDSFVDKINLDLSTKKAVKPANNSKAVKSLPLSQIFTDETRFQNRKKLNQTIVSNIVDNFNETNLDPLIVWLDPKDNKHYILAGHHRFEALRQLNYDKAPVKIANSDYPTEKDAIRFATEESNANRSLEKPYERAEIYRKDRLNGMSQKRIEEKAKIEGKNRSYILNLSHLNPKGRLLQNLIQFDDSTSVQDTREIEKIADWTGQARRNFDLLTNAHENEMLDFLKDKNQAKRTTNKTAFLQLINSTVSRFDFDAEKPLNLKRFKYESQGEKVYNAEVEEIKDEIKSAQEKIDTIKERFLNPKSSNYIKPTAPDYDVTKNVADTKISEYNTQIKNLQSEIIKIYQNKGSYIDAGSNQGALFGAKPKGMKSPQIDAVIQAEPEEAEAISPNEERTAPTQPPKTNSKVRSASDRVDESKFDFFNVEGQVGQFLQRVERKPQDSVVITIDGKQGAGKTTMLYQFMEAFASGGNRSLFASLEQHPDSVLTQDKIDAYISPENRSKLDLVGDFEDQKEFYSIIEYYDVIFIDSWQKLLELVGKINLDKDLRKKFDGKVFVVIFQQTTTGRTKGGASIVFDGDIIIKMETGESFDKNYAYFDKNRYTQIAIEKLRYNIANQYVYDPTKEDQEDQNSEDDYRGVDLVEL